MRPSINLVRENYEAVLAITLLPTLVTAFGSLVLASNHLLGYIITIVGVAWEIVNFAASYYLQLRAVNGKTPSVTECYGASWPFWLKIVGFEILFGISVVVGFILLIVPGAIILRRYYFTPFYVLQNKLSIRQAMERSASQTKPVSGYVWGVFGVLIVFAFVASLVSSILYVGSILAALVSLIYYFGPALRWREVAQTGGKK